MNGDVTAVRMVRDAFVAADSANDGDAMASLLAADVVILHPHRGVITGHSDASQFMREALRDVDTLFVKHARYATVELEVCGSFAFERGEFEQQLFPRDGGDPERERGQYLWLFRKNAAGAWKIARIAGAFIVEESADVG